MISLNTSTEVVTPMAWTSAPFMMAWQSIESHSIAANIGPVYGFAQWAVS